MFVSTKLVPLPDPLGTDSKGIKLPPVVVPVFLLDFTVVCLVGVVVVVVLL